MPRPTARALALALAVFFTALACASGRPPVSTGAAASPSSSVASPPISASASAGTPTPHALPLVVIVRADWCPVCRRIEPTLEALKTEYAGRATFVILDVTDDERTARSKTIAEQAGVGKYFEGNNVTGVVAIFTPSARFVAKLSGERDLLRYRKTIAAASEEP